MAPRTSCLPLPPRKALSRTGSQSYPATTDAHASTAPLVAARGVVTTSLDPKAIRSWGGKVFREYQGLAHDEDMWMPEGTVLVFFSDGVNVLEPKPAFRLHLDAIDTESLPFLRALLQKGENVKPPERGPGSRASASGIRQSSRKRHSTSYLPLPKSVSPLKFPQFEVIPEDQIAEAKRHSWNNTGERLNADNNATAYEFGPTDTEITHQLYFVLPAHYTAEQKSNHQIALRNVLAILHGKPTVGNDFYNMIRDIQYLFHAFAGYGTDLTADTSLLMRKYIKSKRLEDVRYDLNQAMGLLAWSEHPTVRWSRGYLEAFVHSAGMLSPTNLLSPEFQRLSPITQLHLENAFKALELTIVEAEERFATFDFAKMWDLQNMPACPARISYEAFRVHLLSFFKKRFGSWPPKTQKRHWLTRCVVTELQNHFTVLYEHLVDRDIHWNRLKACYRRELEMTPRDPANDAFMADRPGLPITDIITAFDDFHKLEHIPCPFPQIPKSSSEKKTPENQSRRERLRSMLTRSSTKAANAKAEKQTNAIAFRAAANYGILRAVKTAYETLIPFHEHETEFSLQKISLRDARIGRWILIYGALQVLSLLSVDVGGLSYTEDVSYPLCASVTGIPPWKPDSAIMEAATQERSHCWTAPFKWNDNPQQRPIYTPSRSGVRSSISRATQTPETQDYGSRRKSSATLPPHLQPTLQPPPEENFLEPAKRVPRSTATTSAVIGDETTTPHRQLASPEREHEEADMGYQAELGSSPGPTEVGSSPELSLVSTLEDAASQEAEQDGLINRRKFGRRIGEDWPLRNFDNTATAPPQRPQFQLQHGVYPPNTPYRTRYEDDWFLRRHPRSGRQGLPIPSFYEPRSGTPDSNDSTPILGRPSADS